MENEEKTQVKDVTVKKVLGWFFMGVFLLTGISTISESLIISLVFSALAILVFPKLNEITRKHGNFILSGWLKFIIGLILFSIGISAINKDIERERETARVTAPVNRTYTNETSYSQPQEKREWVFVYEMRAKNDKQSLAFFLEGGQQTVLYWVQGGYFSLRVVPEGTQPNIVSHGVVSGLARHGLNDQTIMRKSRGYYYLDLAFGGGDATIQIYEYR